MQIYTLRRDGGPLRIKLDGAALRGEPDAWGDRHRLTFEVPARVAHVFVEIEENCRHLLESGIPTIHALWLANVRPTNASGATLKAKVNTRGFRVAKFYDGSYKLSEPPSSWCGLRVDVIIHARCVCVQKQSVTLILEVTAVRYDDVRCPFTT